MPTHRIVLYSKGQPLRTVQECDSYAEAALVLSTFQTWALEGEEYVIDDLTPPAQSPPPSAS